MPTIKVVPFPGVPGPRGDQGPRGYQGETGLTGPQGQPGSDGADALWNFLGEYNNGADYSIGDVVTYNGGTYYRVGEPNPGYPPGTSYWTTIAEPGADAPVGAGANGEVTRWSPNFQATGLSFTGSGTTYPTYNSHYVKNGRMVSFWIEIDLVTVTDFGTGQYLTELPFTPLAGTMNHFQAWCLVDETANPDNAGHAILQADHLANTSVLDLHYLKQSGGANSPIMEAQFKQGSPLTLTTATHIYINGTYITEAN